MYASDYPHGESHFPESVSLVLDWEMDAERKRKLLWDNAIHFYAIKIKGQSVSVAMRAATGRLSLRTTGRARMLSTVDV
jgi:hypothetical protein